MTKEQNVGVTREKALVRFWAKVSKDGPVPYDMAQSCWLWTGALDQQGYPRFRYRHEIMYANRALYRMTGKHLRPDRNVVSLCQVKACVNPAHHALGTNTDAKALGRKGFVCLGMQSIYRDAVQGGHITPKELAMYKRLTLPVVEAIINAGQ